MAKNIVFSFEDLSTKDKVIRAIGKYFTRAGANIVQSDVGALKRTSGVTYKELSLTFADSQQVILRVKQTGDVYQVLLNGKQVPIRNQDDHPAAITEIAKLMDKGRSAHQKKMAKVLAKPPASVRTAAPTMEKVLTQKRDDLKTAIAEVRTEIAALQGNAAA